jgi:hypothetical protein
MSPELQEIKRQAEDQDMSRLALLVQSTQVEYESGNLTKEEFFEILEDIKTTQEIAEQSNSMIWRNRLILAISTLMSLY